MTAGIGMTGVTGPRRAARRALAVLALLGALGACGVPADDSARTEPPEAVPFGLLESPPTTAAPDPAGAATATAVLCLVRDDELVAVTRDVSPDATPSDVLRELTGAPSRAEASMGLTTALPEDAVDPDVSVAGGVATVDLTDRFADTEGRRQQLAVTQLVCTLTERAGIGQVAFTLDGEPVEVPRGDGSSTSEPVARDDYQALLP